MEWLEVDLQARFSGRILPVDFEAKRKGTALSVIDGLLAATALHHNLTVVSRNAGDFTNTQVQVLNPWQGVSCVRAWSVPHHVGSKMAHDNKRRASHMAAQDDGQTHAPNTPIWARISPGLGECKRRIARLRRFQDLIRHRELWGPQMEFARPLEELIGNAPPVQRPEIIKREISKLIIPVLNDLDRVGVTADRMISVDSDDIDERLALKRKREPFNLIEDYFLIPREHGRPEIFDDLHVLDTAIGAYEAHAERAKRNQWNPLEWFIWIIRKPAELLERSGLAYGTAAGDKGLRFIAWLLGLLALIILLSLGVSIPLVLLRYVWGLAF